MRKSIIYLLLTALMFTGCDNFLSDYSQDLVAVKTVEECEEVLLGSAYVRSKSFQQLGGSYLNSAEMLYWLNYMDDDVNGVVGIKNNGSDSHFQNAIYGYATWQLEVGRNVQGTDVSPDDGSWNALYSHINICNILLNKLSEIDAKSEADKKLSDKVRGECLFIRAQLYLMLVNCYAKPYAPQTAATTEGVPLKTTYYVEKGKVETSAFKRNSVAEVYNQIVLDLKESIAAFGRSPQNKKFIRASEPAAHLLLSRVYLYMQQWQLAIDQTNEFLRFNPELAQMSSYASGGTFMAAENPEMVFSQGSLTYQTKTLGAEPGAFCVTRDLYNLYDTLDNVDYRTKAFFTDPLGKATDSIGISGKFNMTTHQSYVSDILLLRTAEAYLNQAEAYAMLDQSAPAQTALATLLKTRIKGYKTTNLTGEDLVKLIRNERRKELCFEGHRWFDLRRYAVTQTYSQAKSICRVFPVYADNNTELFQVGYIYTLPAGDPSWTLQIPTAVLEFDKFNPNERSARLFDRTFTLTIN